VLISIWISIEFYRYVGYFESGGVSGSPYHPPGAEAYLPISSLMSFIYFLRTGIVHPVHPAGFFLFIAFIVMSFIAGKSFCSWICPIGLLSDLVASFGEKIFRRRIRIPRFIDYVLRSLKYLLLFFFLSSILTMTAVELRVFLDSEYNIAADIKLYDFFRYLSGFSMIVLTALLLLSVVIRNFWCRYLCPYGALFGILSLLSVVKILRKGKNCINCDLCDKACPSNIKVSKAGIVLSDECTTCLECIDACPVKDTLVLRVPVVRKTISKFTLILVTAGVYIVVLFYAVLSGHWRSNTPIEKMRTIYEHRNEIGH
jgi:polyferredoxin